MTIGPTQPIVIDKSSLPSEGPSDYGKMTARERLSQEAANESSRFLAATKTDASAPYVADLTICWENENCDTSPAQLAAKPSQLNNETIKQYAAELHDAINRDRSFLGINTGDDPDNEKITNLLDNLTAADRDAIEEAYKSVEENTDHRSLWQELEQNQSKDDFAKTEAILNRRDGRANDAGNLMVSLEAMNDDRGDAVRRVIESFATLNSEQIQQLEQEFQEDYGKSVNAALKEFGLSDDAMKAVDFARKPINERTAKDIEDFARFSIDKGNFDFFSIALRGDSPAAVEARKKLSGDAEFKQKIAETFKVHQDGGDQGFSKSLPSNVPGVDLFAAGLNLVEQLCELVEAKEVDSKLLQSMDILQDGRVSLATIAADNTGTIFGWFDNKEAISNASSHATDTEKQLFVKGRQIAEQGGETHSDEDKVAFDFYKRIHDAFSKAGDDEESQTWEDQLVNGKGEESSRDQSSETPDQSNESTPLVDLIHEFVVDENASSVAIAQRLQALSGTERQNLKEEYIQKYGAILDHVVLSKVAEEERNNFRTLLTATEVDGRQDFYDNLESGLKSKSGYSLDGSEAVLDRALSIQAAALADFQARFEKLPPEKQELANKYFSEALKDYKESKEQFAENMYQAAVIVAGVGLAVVTGGVGLVALAAVAAAGAIGRIALKKVVQGEDYDLSLGNVLKDGAIGGVTAGLSVIGPETVAALSLVGKRAVSSLGDDLVQGLSRGVLEREVNNLVSRSIVRGEAISDDAIREMVKKAGAKGLDPTQRAALESALKTSMGSVDEAVKMSLIGSLRQAAAFGTIGGTTNVAIEGTVAAASGHNLSAQQLLTSFGIGSVAGAGISGTFDGVVAAASRARPHAPQSPSSVPALERGQIIDSVVFAPKPEINILNFEPQQLESGNLSTPDNAASISHFDKAELPAAVRDPKELARGMESIPSSSQLRDLLGTDTIGSLPAEFQSGGFGHAESVERLNELAKMLRSLDGSHPYPKKTGPGSIDIGIPKFEIPFGTKTVSVKKVGVGETAHVYKLSVDGKDFAFKVPTDPARTDIHGLYAEVAAYTFLSKHQIKDLTQFHSANPEGGWMMTEFVHQASDRPGVSIDQVLSKHNLHLGDDWPVNRGPGGIVWDLGGLEPVGVGYPKTLEEFKTLMQTAEGRMLAGRRVEQIKNQDELKEALLLSLTFPEAAGQVARSAVRHLKNPSDINDILSRALETKGAAGRAAFELDSLVGTQYFKDLFYKALENPESRIEAAKHLARLPVEDRSEAFSQIFQRYPEGKAMAARAISSIPQGIQRQKAIAMARKSSGSNFVLSKLPENFVSGKEGLAAFQDLIASINGKITLQSLPPDQAAWQLATSTSSPVQADALLKYISTKIPKPDTPFINEPGRFKSTFSEPDGSKIRKYPGGYKIIEKDGVLTLQYPSGKSIPWHMPSETMLPDGTRQIKHADGTQETITTDNTITTNYPNGVTSLVFPDKRIEILHTDGRIEKHFPDGTKETINTDGSSFRQQADGKDIKRSADGTTTIRDHVAEGETHASSFVNRLNEDVISQKQVQELLDSVPPAQQALARQFITAGLQNSNDYAFLSALRSLKQQIPELDLRVFTLEPGKLADAEAYLVRKANGLEFHIENLSDSSKGQYKDYSKKWLIFGDLKAMSPEQRANLSVALGQGKSIQHVDLGLEKGLNFIDFSTKTAAAKLQSLIDEAKSKVAANPSLAKLSDEELAEYVLYADNIEAARQLNLGQPIRPHRLTSEELFSPTVTSKQMDDYLQYKYQSVRDRSQAAKFLNRNADYTSFKGLADDARRLRSAIGQTMGRHLISKKKGPDYAATATPSELDAAGLEMEKDAIYIVGDSSDALITSIYRNANNIDSGQFVTVKQFNQMKLNSQIGDRQVVFIDDTAYSGTQLNYFIADNLQGLETKPIVANFGSYKTFAISMFKAQDSLADLVTLKVHIPLAERLNSAEGKRLPILRSIDETSEAKEFFTRTNRGDVYKSLHSVQIFPFMTSDTSASVVKEFAREVLKIQNPIVTESSKIAENKVDPLLQFSQFKWIPKDLP